MSPIALVCVALGAPPGSIVEPHPIAPVQIRSVTIDDPFWSPKLEALRAVTLPDVLAKFEKDGALGNFDRIRDGASGPHAGPPWHDGLIYETMRAACDFLQARPDPDLD